MSKLFKPYKERLLNPKWREKRIAILKRDNHCCQLCGEKSIPLHVHHLCYNINYDPWDIDDSALITLCEICHKNGHIDNLSILEKELFSLIRMSGMTGNYFTQKLVKESNKLILKHRNNG